VVSLVPRLPLYAWFRATGWPPQYPLNLTLGITSRCNSQCQTCNIHKITSEELNLDEWRQVFHSLGRSAFWVTISGGEPFLRSDLPALVKSLYDICQPAIINIPTNGLLSPRIPEWVAEIAQYCTKAQVIINLSVDELGHRHDQIRGVKGNFDKVMEAFHALKRLHFNNLTAGFHTVISKFNVQRIPEIHRYLMGLSPDSYVAEIAEEREELGTIGCDIAPEPEAYARAVDYLIATSKGAPLNRMGKIARAFRREYHRIVKRILEEKRQVIPCYAGVASAHIAPDGDVWACCTRADLMGNLRENHYDFSRLWFSEKADHIRNDIKMGRCWCPLANVSYTNMLLHPKTLIKVGRNYAIDD
jgi:MoaA/NifB/PqqE/SkfB family radical SAM enzyme